MATYIWLRITLSYCVVGAVITTLLSAYIQTVSLPTISLIMTLFLFIGVYNAEVARRYTGLNRYLITLSHQKRPDL
ncbi:MAG: hypothetical protein ACJA2G_001215 [Cognaticolwellia sp.]|jgi:hypothetical protein